VTAILAIIVASFVWFFFHYIFLTVDPIMVGFETEWNSTIMNSTEFTSAKVFATNFESYLPMLFLIGILVSVISYAIYMRMRD
jgi:hypothetical protein